MVDITAFKNKWLGGRVDYDHVYQFQCVDLVRQYFYENFGLGDAAGGVPYAISYWTNTPSGLLTKFDKVEGSNAQQGDVVVLKTAGRVDYQGAGHIGIATGNINGDFVEVIEQNGSTGNGSGVGPDAIRTRYIVRSRVAGLLRPKVTSPPPPAPAPQKPYRVEAIDPKFIRLKPDPTNEWNLNHTTWPSFNDDPISHRAGEILTVNGVARHDLGGNYYMQNRDGDRGFNAVDCEDYTPPPAVPAADPVPAAAVSYLDKYTFVKIDSPLMLQTKIDANLWNLDFHNYPDVKSNALLPKGTKFLAYGKAIRNDLDNPVYFMTEEDFTDPRNAQGINTVDLEPAMVSFPAPPPVAPTEHEDGSVDIPVNVIPSDPNKWKESFSDVSAGVYFAVQSIVIHDIEGANADIQLVKDQTVNIGGTFIKDGVTYFRTKKSVQNGWWYGIPTSAITLDDLDEEDDIFDLNLPDELREALSNSSFRQRTIVVFATITGFFQGVLSRFKRKKK